MQNKMYNSISLTNPTGLWICMLKTSWKKSNQFIRGFILLQKGKEHLHEQRKIIPNLASAQLLLSSIQCFRCFVYESSTETQWSMSILCHCLLVFGFNTTIRNVTLHFVWKIIKICAKIRVRAMQLHFWGEDE